MLEIKRSDNKDLKKMYKFTYKCFKCRRLFGTDIKEEGKHLCPFHDDNFKDNLWRNR